MAKDTGTWPRHAVKHLICFPLKWSHCSSGRCMRSILIIRLNHLVWLLLSDILATHTVHMPEADILCRKIILDYFTSLLASDYEHFLFRFIFPDSLYIRTHPCPHNPQFMLTLSPPWLFSFQFDSIWIYVSISMTKESGISTEHVNDVVLQKGQTNGSKRDITDHSIWCHIFTCDLLSLIAKV